MSSVAINGSTDFIQYAETFVGSASKAAKSGWSFTVKTLSKFDQYASKSVDKVVETTKPFAEKSLPYVEMACAGIAANILCRKAFKRGVIGTLIEVAATAGAIGFTASQLLMMPLGASQLIALTALAIFIGRKIS